MQSNAFARRDFLKMVAALSVFPAQRGNATDPWDETRVILARIKEPTFPDRDFDVKRYGSINEAITACNAAGGGRVVGDF